MKRKLALVIIVLITSLSIILLIFSIKTLIDMIIYNECLKQEPSVFVNHPVCRRYKDY